ncbi:MAG: tRNA pseudouridine(38-40) synthase TruA [Planctomycetes bacterium]|nr:tRNA pseudouridine(38-40) synthase TruA [Planctomycetota bacterium]
MRNIKLLLAYDGTEYHGWERQKDQRTVQQTLEEAIEALTGEKVSTVASGRTDAGVHALGQVVHFHTDTAHDPATIVRALNAHLPDDIVVREAQEVSLEFHANFDVRHKLYRYVIDDGPVPDPFLCRYACHSKFALDAAAMHRAAQCLLGTHDFHSFETRWPNRASSVRTIMHIAVGRAGPWRLWHPEPIAPDEAVSGEGSSLGDQGPGVGESASRRVGEPEHRESGQGHEISSTSPAPAIPDPRPLTPDPYVYIDVEADGFLYNMVRAIAGTLMNVGRGYWPPERVQAILEARDRRFAGPTAPAQGLFLVRVVYGDRS